MSVKVFARVKLEVEISLERPWGSDVTMAQVDKDARRDAEEYIARLPRGPIRVVSVPEVTAVIVRKDG